MAPICAGGCGETAYRSAVVAPSGIWIRAAARLREPSLAMVGADRIAAADRAAGCAGAAR